MLLLISWFICVQLTNFKWILVTVAIGLLLGSLIVKKLMRLNDEGMGDDDVEPLCGVNTMSAVVTISLASLAKAALNRGGKRGI